MPSTIDRFRKDLARLVDLGGDLDNAMQFEMKPEEFKKELEKATLNPEEREAVLAGAKKGFVMRYDTWYSECLAVLKQILPDRVADFRSFYEKPKSRKYVDYGTYKIQDYLQGLTRRDGGQIVVDGTAAFPQMRQQRAILNAAIARFGTSLYDIRQIVQADLFESELDAARELLKNGFIRAAGAISGVVLERHLKQVCISHSVTISKKNPGIADLNDALKSNFVIEIPQWRHITLLGDYRNLCDHDKTVNPTHEQIQDMVDGTHKITHTVF